MTTMDWGINGLLPISSFGPQRLVSIPQTAGASLVLQYFEGEVEQVHPGVPACLTHTDAIEKENRLMVIIILTYLSSITSRLAMVA